MSLESFDDVEVKTLDDTPEVKEESEIDSFDDDEVKEIPSEEVTGQVDNLEDKEENKEEEKKEPAKEEEKKEEEEPKKEEKPSFVGKPMKLKTPDGKTLEIDDEATVKTKIDGKNEIVTIKELKENYSGKVAYDKKFESLNTDKFNLQKEIETYKAEKEGITGHLQKIASMLDDENTNPLDALNYLVDISGRDTLSYTQKVFNFLSDEVRNLDEMDEVERKLYWNERQLENIRNNQAAKTERESALKAQREQEQRLNQLRESHGVTEEQFVQSHSELESLGYSKESITPEAVVNYTVMKPSFEKAENICSEYAEDLSTDEVNKLVTEVANTLIKNPSLSNEKALETAVNILGWDIEELEELENLNSRMVHEEQTRKSDFPSNFRYGKQNKEEELDMFED